MDTKYIGPHKWERTDGKEVGREFRIESSEAYPEMLDIGTFSYKTGDCLGTAYLGREDVVKFRDALNEWLGES